tara:strand:- start:43182 stop:45452 length:2271 start_codon:yes stop_codon:yes gene_type:complete
MSLNKFQTLALLLFLTFPAMARQSVSVSGYVKDASTGETLISANVALLENNRGSTTNTLGYYTITNLQPGTYILACSYIGYDLYKQEITLKEGDNLRIEISLEPQVIMSEEIIVRSDREQEELKNIGSAQVTTETIKALPAIFEADVFRSIQFLPGVKSASDFSSGLYIRGGGPDQTLILLDQTTVYNPSHFFGFFSTFNPDAIKDVRLYKGGYPAEFGGRLGSVLSIYNKDGNRKRVSGTATLGMLASRAAIEGPWKKGSYMLAIRRSTLEPLLAALRAQSDNIPSKFYFYDINGKLNFDASMDDKFSLAFYSGTDKVAFPFADDAQFVLNYGNQTLSGNWTHIFNEKLFSNFVLTGSRYFNFPEFEAAGTPFRRDNNIYDFSLKSDLEYLPNDKHQIKTGLWAGVFTFRIQDRFDGDLGFTSRIHAQYGSYYVQDTWRPDDRWKIIGGLRASYFSDGDYLRLEPRLSAEFKLTDRIRLQGAYGRYNQFFTLVSNEAFSGFDLWLTAEDGVNPSFGDQFVLGAKTIPFKNYGLDIEVYYRTMNDLFELDPFLPDVAGLLYEELFRVGEGYAYGAEFMFEKQVGKLTGFIGYTLGYTWRKFPGYNIALGDESNTARFYPPKYDRRNDVNLILNYQLSKRWKMTGAWVYATGQSYTRVLGRYATYDSPFLGVDYNNAFVVGKVNASRLPSYHRLDLSFARTGTFFGMGEAEWQFQVINVYNRRNVWFQSFDFDENPVKQTDVTLLPVIPAISYTVKF